MSSNQNNSIFDENNDKRLSTNPKWKVICRTEVQTVHDKPEYGENYLTDFKVFFNVIIDPIPVESKDVKIVLYRLEHEFNCKDLSKANYLNLNLHLQTEMGVVKINRLLLESTPIMKVGMKIRIETPMDFVAPQFKTPEILMGIVKLKSYPLYHTRALLKKSFHIKPYAEVLYSLQTSSSQIMSLEQVYVSKYALSSANAFLSLIDQERYRYLHNSIKSLNEESQLSQIAEEIHKSDNSFVIALSTSNVQNESNAEATCRAMIDSYTRIIDEYIISHRYILESCGNCSKGVGITNNVLPIDVGGNYLRRSVWKTITAWQYCTTNLNVHLMTSKQFTFSDIRSNQGDLEESLETDGHNGITKYRMHCIPTITLGCPSAHELKFHDGGLRKIFGEITDTNQKLRWMFAIQAPDLDSLSEMFYQSPKEASFLFNGLSSFKSKEDVTSALKRKLELSKRIDVCASQALGCAITVIKTLCSLASLFKDKYLDILARSLKIGFVNVFHSMLSTNGSELGMIEDLDMASLWLDLVSFRLVHNSETHSNRSDHHEKVFESSTFLYGVGDGVICHRDQSGRLAIDIELNHREVDVVLEATEYMKEYTLEEPDISKNEPAPLVGIYFSAKPNFNYDESIYNPTVLAIVKVVSITFTQG